MIAGSDSSVSSFQDCTESFFYHNTAIMKFLKPLALLLLVASVVNSVPTKDEEALLDNIEDGGQSDEEMHIKNVLKGMQYEPA